MHVYANKNTPHTHAAQHWLTDWPSWALQNCCTATLTDKYYWPNWRSINQSMSQKGTRTVESRPQCMCVCVSVYVQVCPGKRRSVRRQLGVTQRRSCQHARRSSSDFIAQHSSVNKQQTQDLFANFNWVLLQPRLPAACGWTTLKCLAQRHPKASYTWL